MIVGICIIELYIPGSSSLKDKRQVLKSLKERIRGKFNVSIAEVEAQNLWQRGVIGLSCVGTEKKIVNQIIEKIIIFVKSIPLIEIINYKWEMI